MLGALSMILTTYLILKKRNIDISLESVTNSKLIVFLIVFATLLFWILHGLLSKDKNMSRFEDNWQEDGIRAVRGILVCAEGLLYLFIVRNIDQGHSIFHNAWIIIALIVVLNIIQLVMFDKYYTTSIRELLVDGLLIQIQDTRNALILVLFVLCALHFTIMGAIFIVTIIAIVTGFFK